MNHRSTFVVGILVVLAVGAILAPAAFGKGGAIVRTYAPAPLDAGSTLPNPDYSSKTVRPDDRADRGLVPADAQQAAVVRSSGEAFDWADAGIGAGGVLVVALCIAPLLLLRQAGRKSLART